MTDHQAKARELLAAAYSDAGCFSVSDRLLRTAYTRDYAEVVALRAIEAALRLAVPEWRPIETAPYDGSAFLGCSDHLLDTEGHPLMWSCRFDGYMGYFRSNTDHEPLYDLTHWQPLPAAPTLADEGES